MDGLAEGASRHRPRKDRRINPALEASTKLGRIRDHLLVRAVEQLDALDRAIGVERDDGRSGVSWVKRMASYIVRDASKKRHIAAGPMIGWLAIDVSRTTSVANAAANASSVGRLTISSQM